MANATQDKQREARAALEALRTAERYLAALARTGEIPTTPADLAQAIEQFKSTLTANQASANALVLAVLNNEPCPVSLFKPWASYAQIRLWSLRNDEHRLPAEVLNGKLTVRPVDFFRVLKALGKSAKK